MEKFITGTLLQNNQGATYEDVVYDRRLQLHLPDGRDLWIFDFADPISQDSWSEKYIRWCWPRL